MKNLMFGVLYWNTRGLTLIQGDFLTGPPPKSSKYEKVDLG